MSGTSPKLQAGRKEYRTHMYLPGLLKIDSLALWRVVATAIAGIHTNFSPLSASAPILG